MTLRTQYPEPFRIPPEITTRMQNAFLERDMTTLQASMEVSFFTPSLVLDHPTFDFMF